MDFKKNAETANLAKFLIFGLNFLTFVSIGFGREQGCFWDEKLYIRD